MAAPRNNIPTRPHTAFPPQAPGLRARIIGMAQARPTTAVALALGMLTAVVSAVVFAALPGNTSRYEPPIRARQYSAYTACLLTDSQGITSTSAKPVWTALQAASTATTAQISYLAIQGDTTAATADSYLNTLALRGCNLIVTVGALPDQAVHDRASSYPKLQFAAVDATVSLPSNATAIHAGAIQSIVETSYHAWKNSN